MKLKSFTKALLKTVSIILAIAVVSSAALIDYVISELKKNPDPFVSDMFAEYRKLNFKKPWQEQKQHVIIGGRHFDIPIAYIQSPIGDQIVQDDGINLLYRLPNYFPSTIFKLTHTEEQYVASWSDGLGAHMLLTAESHVPVRKPSELFLTKKRNDDLGSYVGMIYGLEKYTKKNTGITYPDILIEKDIKGKIIGLLECSKENDVPSPGCSYYFEDKNLRYDIYFNRERFLKNWKTQKQTAIKFIDQFEREKAKP
jgi:hypothetical protein